MSTAESAAAPAPSEPASAPLWRQGLAAALVLAVIIGLLASPWRGGFAFFYMGVVPGILALHLSWRIAAASALATAVAVLVGVGLSGSPVAATVWITVLAVGIGLCSRIGLAAVASMVTVQAAIVAISGNVVRFAPEEFSRPHTFAAGLPVAGFALAGGLTVAAAIALFLRAYSRAPAPRLGVDDARWYGAVVLALVVPATAIGMAFFTGTHAWWLMLTILVVLLPSHDETVHRVHDRVLGTIAGALVVMAVVAITDANPVFYALALFGALGTIATVSSSYVLNSALLTITVLAAASPAAHSPLLLHGERIGLTVAGALAAYVVMIGAEHLRTALAARRTRH